MHSLSDTSRYNNFIYLCQNLGCTNKLIKTQPASSKGYSRHVVLKKNKKNKKINKERKIISWICKIKCKEKKLNGRLCHYQLLF